MPETLARPMRERPGADLAIVVPETGPGQVTRTRHRFLRWATEVAPPGADLDGLAVVVSELLANALMSGSPPVTVRGLVEDGVCHIEIVNRIGARPPGCFVQALPDDPLAPDGRGLFVVASYAAALELVATGEDVRARCRFRLVPDGDLP